MSMSYCGDSSSGHRRPNAQNWPMHCFCNLELLLTNRWGMELRSFNSRSETFVNLGSTHPDLLWCDASNLTVYTFVVYIPNTHMLTTQCIDFTLSLTQWTNAIIENGYDAATMGNGTVDNNGHLRRLRYPIKSLNRTGKPCRMSVNSASAVLLDGYHRLHQRPSSDSYFLWD